MIRVSKGFLNEDGKTSIMRNITIHDVVAVSQSIIPSIAAGLPESVIQNIRIYNVRLILPGDVNSTQDFSAQVPENDRGYPENRMFGLKLPANSFYARHVNGLYINNVSITTQAQDIRPVFVFDNVKAAILENVRYNGNHLKSKHIYRAKSTKQAVNQVAK